MAIDEQITRGDLIGASIAAIGLIGAAILSARKYYIHHYPFKMSFSDKSYKDINAIFSSSLTLPVGEKKDMFISIRLREGRNFEVVNLRFVRWNWSKFGFENVPRTVVEVIKIQDQEHRTSLENESDGRGGQTGTFHSPKHLPKDDVLWLQVHVEAKDAFDGYLSFEQKRGDNYRGFVRRRAIFGKPPT